jgi:hypothetical protein
MSKRKRVDGVDDVNSSIANIDTIDPYTDTKVTIPNAKIPNLIGNTAITGTLDVNSISANTSNANLQLSGNGASGVVNFSANGTTYTNSATNYSPSSKNIYQHKYTDSPEVAGAISAGWLGYTNGRQVTRDGGIVTIQLAPFAQTATTTQFLDFFTPTLISWAVPSNNVQLPILVQTNTGTNVMGSILITTAGDMRIFSNQTNGTFTNANVVGLPCTITFTYMI